MLNYLLNTPTMRIESLSKSYGFRTLFADINYSLPEGERIALVGSNGAGKSTLLNILCGLDSSDTGTVKLPKNTDIGYLPQSPNPMPGGTVIEECITGAKKLFAIKEEMDEWEGKIASGSMEAIEKYSECEAMYAQLEGYSIEARATSILHGLGFSEAMTAKNPTELSGGWRMRLELAKIFIQNPTFLILDEPTNHLDLPSLIWVESWLKSFKGTLLFVSHDRALLNRLSTITLHLFGGKLRPYPGNFDKFLVTRELNQELELKKAANLEQKRVHMEKFVEKFGAKASKATQAQSRVKMIEKIRTLESELEIDDAEQSLKINIPEAQKSPRIAVEIKDGCIGYDQPLSSGINLTLEKGHKIGIIGANGIGKSTLLKTLCGLIPSLAGEFKISPTLQETYFAQDQLGTIDMNQTVLDNILHSTELGERDSRALLGSFMFSKDDVDKTASVLSGGELSRLGLAKTLGLKSGLLILDEPTNHLDMSSVAMLCEALAQYTGNLLFVSHDRTFIDAVSTHIFAMIPDGRSMLFEGKLDDYASQAALANFPNVLEIAQDSPKKEAAPVAEPKTGNYRESKSQKRQRDKLKRQVSDCESKMTKIKKQISDNEKSLLNVAPADHIRLKELAANNEKLGGELEELELKWLEHSEALDGLLAE